MKKTNDNSPIADILNEIFEKREDLIYTLTPNEKNQALKKSETYTTIQIAIDNIPDDFVQIRKGIENSVDTHLEYLNELQGNENEKFYKQGFADAINLFINCMQNYKSSL